MDPSVFARIAILSAILAISSPNAAATPTPIAGYTIYVVQSGDTLASIAAQFATTTDALQTVNNLTDSSPILPGERLQVPAKQTALAATPTAPATPGKTITYTVKSGDTLNSIASNFNVSVDDLASVNNIADVNSISVGEVLAIPGTGAPAASTIPDGISLTPSTVRQGDTVEIGITASDVVTASGTFGGAPLRFDSENGKIFALAGISRGAALTSYPVALTLTNSAGTANAVNFKIRVNSANYPAQDITLTPGMASLLDPAVEIAENNRISNIISQYTPQQYWSGPFSLPLKVTNYVITAIFGERRSYNGGPVGLCGHEGQDFAIDGGTPAYAPAAGIVVLAEPLKVRGNVVIINHGLGVYSGFYHLSEIDVKAGQQVNQGDMFGRVGTTGFSTGDHLHWSLWVPGVLKTSCSMGTLYDDYADPIQWTTRTIP